MNKFQKTTLLISRIFMGWLFFYAGITKVVDPGWSAAGYLNNAKFLSGFYSWLASPGLLPIVNFLNEWGLTVVGATLILGLFTRWAAGWGAILMVLYYLPILEFPYVGSHSFLVDEHIIYIGLLLILATFNAGMYYGLDAKLVAWSDRVKISKKADNQM